MKVSRQSDKKEIFADYFNSVYFGRGAYGMESASQAYFGKNVWELNVSEVAVLIGVIQMPSRWDPALDPRRTEGRWNFVLDAMVAQGWLTAEHRMQARFPIA